MACCLFLVRVVGRSLLVPPGAVSPSAPRQVVLVPQPNDRARGYGIIAPLVGEAPERDNTVDQDGQAWAGRREGAANVEITLRDVRDSDLPAFWAQMGDERAQHMAAVTRRYHYDRAAFDAHWGKVRSDPAVIVRT